MKWQPMETASRDGSTILIWDEVYDCHMTTFFESTFYDQWMQFGTGEILWPIAWMPLPERPNEVRK